MQLEQKKFERQMDGKPVGLFKLKNKNQLQSYITNYGARWIKMLVPDKDNDLTNIITGFDSLDKYINASNPYYGAMIGRFANRIDKGCFKLEGKEYHLSLNEGNNHLHGGFKGFHAVVWDIIEVTDNSVKLRYSSADGEEGYPGNIETTVDYLLNDANQLQISFTVATDRTTIVNITNHAFFNLNGQGSGPITDHFLTINADYYTPVNEELIPYGDMKAVDNTPFDFRKPMGIGARINEDDEQLKNGKGYDHNFILNKNNDDMLLAAKAEGDRSGIQLEIFTTEPGLQFYSGSLIEDNIIDNGLNDIYRSSFCLETQHFPDSPNHSLFPSVTLYPGKPYNSTTIFGFKISE